MAKIAQLPTRQRVRKALLLVSFLLFPVTLYYFSPAIVLDAASQGIVSGSLLAFGAMFLSSLLVGRLWCGWACPAGALQELGEPINARPTPGWINWIKWGVWVPWAGLIAGLAASAGGFHEARPLYQLQGGLTLAIPWDGSGPPWYAIYYIILALFLGLAVALGRRAGCHAVCWMAPFMILGRKARNLLAWPSLRLAADTAKCTSCLTCTRNCPMSLDVNAMVQRGEMEEGECILCGTCVDHCPQGAIRYSFSGGR